MGVRCWGSVGAWWEQAGGLERGSVSARASLRLLDTRQVADMLELV